MSWQDRDAAPFGQEVWDALDRAARSGADEVRAVRRLLGVLGPLGFDARAGVAEDVAVDGDGDEAEGEDEAHGRTHVHVPRVRALPVLHRTFSLGARQVEAFARRGVPLVLTSAAEAGRRMGGVEDRLLLQGHAGARVRGLLEHEGAVALGLGDWGDPGRAADELLDALARLDQAGRHGPYAAALSPGRYYQLLRPYAGSALTPYQQLLPVFEAGIVKAPALADGALVVERSESGPKVVVGQELTAAYDGREGIFHLISLIESVTLLPGAPGSVALLRAGR